MKNSLKISKVIKPFKKTLKIEGDKSISIRWALLASQALGKSKCYNLLKSLKWNNSRVRNGIPDNWISNWRDKKSNSKVGDDIKPSVSAWEY